MAVLGKFLTVAGVGIGLGLAGALAASRVLSGLLFQVSATDPATFLGVGLFLILVSAVAVLLPASRASRVEPVSMLRSE